MAIPVFADVFMPAMVINSGLTGRLIRRNERNTQVSGHGYINVAWEQALREYEFGTVPMRREAWQAIATLHEVTEGGASGFLLTDPTDSTVTAGGVVTALTSTTFQMWKRYTHAASARTKDRKITRPKASGLVVMISGVPTGAYTLDATTGILTIASAPAAANVTWTGSFYVPVHFMSDVIDWTMVVPGQDPDARFLAGANVVLQEIRE
jgi:uncharacterized protein (TIGR02217 family)